MSVCISLWYSEISSAGNVLLRLVVSMSCIVSLPAEAFNRSTVAVCNILSLSCVVGVCICVWVGGSQLGLHIIIRWALNQAY